MSHQFKVSKRGLKLIKAFEGFFPVDQTLVTGQRVVGYGHKLRDDKARMVTREEADALLLEDLAPYEHMINTNVYAPITQNQFDALCSLSFNIGPRLFMNSETMHALNNGRPLDAANGFDVWRKSQINGRVYVIDALMRRRASEKALFLRPETGRIAASRMRLKPVEDERAFGTVVDDDLPLFEESGMVTQAPFIHDDLPDETRLMPSRRREDGPAGTLTLSEVYDEAEFAIEDEDFSIVDPNRPSPIAVAAAEVSDRLDALIDENRQDVIESDVTDDWPETLISSPDEPTTLEVENAIAPTSDYTDESWVPDTDFETVEPETIEVPQDVADMEDVLDDLDIELTVPPVSVEPIAKKPVTMGPYLIMIVTGLTLIGASLGAIYKGAEKLIGESGPFWASVGILIGAMLVIGALYYLLKSIFSKR